MAYIPDEAIIDSNQVSQTAFRMFCYFCKFGGMNNNRVTVSLESVAEFFGIDYSNACRYNAELKRAGWIVKDRKQTVLIKGFEKLQKTSVIEKTDENYSFQDEKTVKNVSEKLQKTSVAYKEEPALLNQRGETPQTHPAIKMVQSILRRYPTKDLWDRIIREIGENPDVEFFKSSFEIWRSVNGNPNNLEKWLFIPNQTKKPPEIYGSKVGTDVSQPVFSMDSLAATENEFIKSLKHNV